MKKTVTFVGGILAAALFSVHAEETPVNTLEGAKVIHMSSTTIKGYVNIARRRNCVVASHGSVMLAPCEDHGQGTEEIKNITFIVPEEGQCLTDLGDGSLGLVKCHYSDTRQQWQAAMHTGTEVRNVASRQCLTANGLNKSLTTTGCSGIPAQYWHLPE